MQRHVPDNWQEKAGEREADNLYHRFSTALFHKGLLQIDGRYLDIPTPHHGTVRLTDHMGFDHHTYAKKVTYGLRAGREFLTKEDRVMVTAVREEILARSTPILSLQVLETDESYMGFDPRVIKSTPGFAGIVISSALRALSDSPNPGPHPLSQHCLFLHVGRHAGQVIDPLSTPVITEAAANLPHAVHPEKHAID